MTLLGHSWFAFALPQFPMSSPPHNQPAPSVSMCTFRLLTFGFPQLWLRFGPWVLPALKNSSAHWPYRTQDKAIRGEGWTLISLEFVWAHDFRDHISHLFVLMASPKSSGLPWALMKTEIGKICYPVRHG